jgi:hypothetical protein
MAKYSQQAEILAGEGGKPTSPSQKEARGL